MARLTQLEMVELIEKAGLLPVTRHEWNEQAMAHVEADAHIEGDMANLFQLIQLVESAVADKAVEGDGGTLTH